SLAMLGHSVGMTFPLSRAFSTAPGQPRSRVPLGQPRSRVQAGSPQHIGRLIGRLQGTLKKAERIKTTDSLKEADISNFYLT
ncbi:MAG: hypothetical protein ABIG42_05700, partial [bacterium]